MENKENVNNMEMYPQIAKNKIETMNHVYSSNVYTFASRNQIDLPPRIVPSYNSYLLDENKDELDQIFHDVNVEKIQRYDQEKIKISEKVRKRYGISGCFLSEPIPIPMSKPELKRSPSMLF